MNSFKKRDHTLLPSGDRFGPEGVILMYHRVAEIQPDPWGLSVSPRNFAEHLDVLNKYGWRALQLQQFAGMFKGRKLPHRWFAITFDDGYADNLHSAKPLLERWGIPATMFIITGTIGSVREFWWDELERILLQPHILPELLRLSIGGAHYEWNLGDETYTDKDVRGSNFWREGEKNAPRHPRHSVYLSLHKLLMPLPVNKRRESLDELLAWAGVSSVGRLTHRCVSKDEISDLTQGELIEIGAHSVTHTDLMKLPAESQREEIQKSKVFLENVTGRPVTSFSYPFGSYSEDTVDILKESGFTCACSVSAAIVKRQTDVFHLPRIAITDSDGEEFSRCLRNWLRGGL